MARLHRRLHMATPCAGRRWPLEGAESGLHRCGARLRRLDLVASVLGCSVVPVVLEPGRHRCQS